MCKVDKAAKQRIHRECAELFLLDRFVAAAARDIRHAVSLALAVQDAQWKEKNNESFYRSFDDFRCFHGSPDGEAVKTASPVVKRTQAANHKLSQRCDSPRNSSSSSNSETRNALTKALVKFYD